MDDCKKQFKPSDRMKKIMKMASRSGGVMAQDVDPKNIKSVVDSASNLMNSGVLSAEIEPDSNGRLRYYVSPEQATKFHLGCLPPKHKPTQFSLSSESPLASNGYRSQAWWNKTAREGDHGFVEPVFTNATKITYCPGFTSDPIKSNTFNRSA